MAENFGDQVVENAIESAGTATYGGGQEAPWYLNAAEDLPGLGTSVAFTGRRGANTILRGGWADAPGRLGRTINAGNDTFRGGSIRNNNPFRPRNWSRYGSQDIFHGASGKYTPFQFLNRGGNFIARKVARGEMAKAMGAGGQFFERGTLSRLGAAGRVGSMSDKAFGKAAPHLTSMFQKGGMEAAEAAATAGSRTAAQGELMMGAGAIGGAVAGATGATTREAAEAAVKAGGKKAVAGRMALKSLGRVDDLTKAGLTVGKKMGLRGGAGLMAGAYKAGGGKLLGKAAGTLALRGVGIAAKIVTGPIGWALMAYDVAKLGVGLAGSAIKGSVRTAADAYKSFMGGMNTGPMEGGWKDNSVSITSRQRGVMAIQNSRLNARSALGTEAASMAQHFG